MLEGFANDGTASVLRRSPQSLENIFKAEDDLKDKRYFNPRNLEDARERNFVSIVRRRGQAKFRRKLIEIYNGKCCITGSDALEALEAAHIIPFLGPETNHHQNGLLLRSDVHNLFDLGLIAIDSTDYSVVIDRDLEATSYQNLSGVQINLPEEPDHHPQKQALEQHRMWAGI